MVELMLTSFFICMLYTFFGRLQNLELNLYCSNAIKFTHEGKVGINLRVVPENSRHGVGHQSAVSAEEPIEANSSAAPQSSFSPELAHIQIHGEDQYSSSDGGPGTSTKMEDLIDEDREKHHHTHELIVWLSCDVCDTGIGIPGTSSYCFCSILRIHVDAFCL